MDKYQNLTVYVGTNYTEGNYVNAGYRKCGLLSDVTGMSPGDLISISCTGIVTGRYVAIVAAMDDVVYCEVEVFYHDGKCSFYLTYVCKILPTCHHRVRYCVWQQVSVSH